MNERKKIYEWLKNKSCTKKRIWIKTTDIKMCVIIEIVFQCRMSRNNMSHHSYVCTCIIIFPLNMLYSFYDNLVMIRLYDRRPAFRFFFVEIYIHFGYFLIKCIYGTIWWSIETTVYRVWNSPWGSGYVIMIKGINACFE